MSSTAHPGHHGTFGFPPVTSPAAHRHRGVFMRTLRGGGIVLGTLLLFLVAVISGVLLHLNTPRARRLLSTEVNSILALSFQGKITIRRIGGIGIFGLSGTDGTIDDPTGKQVLAVRGVHVGIATLAAARSALLDGKHPITIHVTGVSVDSADVRLDTDDGGKLELLDALAPSKPSTTPSSPNARGVRVVAPDIALGHLWAHGSVAGAPPLDVDVDGFRASVTYSPDVLEAKVSRAKITARRIANGADVVGSLEAYLKKPSDEKVHPTARVAWEGTVGGIAQSIHGSLVNDVIDAAVDVPEARPESIRAIWAASPIDRPARLYVEAHGPLAGVNVGLHAGLGDAAFDADGHVVLGDEKTANIALGAHAIDVHEFAASAPHSRLGLTGDVAADMKPDGALSGSLAIQFLGGNVGTNTVPTASIHATLSRSASRQLRSNAEIVIDEPGAPTQLDVQVAPKGDASAIDFQLDSNVEDFQRVPQLAHGAYGKLRLSAAGEVDLANEKIDAQAQVQAAGLSQGTNHVQSASLEARATGPLAAPQIDASVRARGILAGGLHFVRADVRANGAATAPHVTASVRGPDTPDVDAVVDVGLRGGLSLGALRVALARAGERSLVTAREVRLGGGDLSVDDAHVVGLGAPLTASVAMTKATMSVRAETRGIDLARVARLAHIEKNLQGGTVSLDTDLHLRRGAGDGHLVLDLQHLSAANAKNARAHAELTLKGRTVTTQVHADLPGTLVLDLTVPKVSFAGSGALTAAAWREAFGSMDVDARADLGKLAALVPPQDLPLSEAAGDVVLKGHVARESLKDMTPALDLVVTTDKLVLAPRISTERDIDGVLVHPLPAWRLSGVDFGINGNISGGTGLLRMSAKAHDAKGPLAQLDATSDHFPYADLLDANGRLMADLRATNVNLQLVVPPRGLGSLPPILQQHFVTGKAQANISVLGTMLSPTVDVAASLRQASFSGNVVTTPLDVDITARYDGRKGTGSVKARSRDKVLLDLETQVEAVAAQFFEARGAAPTWRASARAHMASFPLQSIAALDDKLVQGNLSGDLTLDGLHEDAHVDARLTIDPVSVGSVAYKSANVVLKADGHVIDGSFRIDQTDGFVDANAHAMASWGAAMAPTLDPSQPLDATLSAKNFRIAALLPFVDQALDELDGRLDADTKAVLDPRDRTARLSGTLDLTRGTIESPAGGGEFHDITASLRLAPDGTITLQKLTAEGLTGKLEASGMAHLQGTTLQTAKAVVTIPGNAAIPLTAGGVELGDVAGRLDISAATARNGVLDVKVDVPKMDVKLPEASTGSPAPLGPMEKGIRIGAHRGDPARFVLLPLDPTKKSKPPSTASSGTGGMTIATHLAEVHVVRGTELKVDLDGNVSVSTGAASKVTGQILLKSGGTLNIQGRTFTIENGTVTFVGDDPSNPQVVVTASWGSPDGITVYAKFVGPLKTGRVTLSSQPRLTKDEIVQLLLFGSADGKQAQTPSSSTTNSAIATAGGEAAQPLNHMLNQLGLGRVSANIDTSQAANPKPEIEVQIARQLSVELAVVLGVPPPGVNPDTVLLTLDWRLFSKWSLATTVGNAGTTIFDLLWQRRY